MNNKTQNIVGKRNLPKEVFLHLLAMITLYWSAIGFITLLFQCVNYLVPDVLADNFYPGRYLGPLRFAISSLIIVFPVFILTSWILYKSYMKDSEKREFKLRKWLLYFTIFTAALIIIGDLVRVIYGFLGGEITLRFILKALSVLFVASIIFGYYIDDVRRERPSKSARYFVWLASFVVLIAIIGGFLLAGSPAEQRLLRFDEQKINDLQNIQANIINYWQRKEKLPETLNDLKDSIAGYGVPIDPQTKKSYEYVVKGDLSFELCAVFNKAFNKAESSLYTQEPIYYPGNFSESWNHGIGRVCFERTIDKQLYPPLNKKID